MRRLVCVALAAALVLLSPAAAEAAKSSSRKDPQGDVLNGSGLDMRQVKMVKKGGKIVVTFTTWNAFTDEDLQAPGGLGVDFRVTKKLVRGAAVRWTSTGVHGEVCSYRQTQAVPAPAHCSVLPATRVSATSYRLTVPVKKIDQGARTVSWLASSMAVDGAAGCDSSFCLDGVGRGARYTTWRF